LSFVASLVVPLSDYVLRTWRRHASAEELEASRYLERQAERRAVVADAQLMLYSWVAARGQVVVSRLAVEQAEAHRGDAEEMIPLGLATRADALRLEAEVASAEQLLAEAEAFLDIADEQLRVAIGAADGERLAIGFDVFEKVAIPPRASLRRLQRLALRRRPELRALDASRRSLEQARASAHAGYAPQLDAFANGYLQNPNPRQIPTRNEFFFTWDAGVQLTWTINDSFRAIGEVAEADAEVRAVEARRRELELAVKVEVARANADIKKAHASISASERQLVSATEALRARHELFRAGEGDAVDIVDAETELTRARLNRIRAYVDLRGAETRLAHSTGASLARRSR
jgi:outer membrane protein TolC